MNLKQGEGIVSHGNLLLNQSIYVPLNSACHMNYSYHIGTLS